MVSGYVGEFEGKASKKASKPVTFSMRLSERDHAKPVRLGRSERSSWTSNAGGSWTSYRTALRRDWLRQNASVEVVSRDRFPTYDDAISAGAPRATQVTDRWHLVRNLAEALDEFLTHKRPVLRAAAEADGGRPAAVKESALNGETDASSPSR